MVYSNPLLAKAMSDPDVSRYMQMVKAIPGTYGHEFRTGRTGAVVAGRFLPDPADALLFVYGCLLHDTGKYKIPLSILLNPEKLEGSDLETMKMHPRFGFEMLRAFNPYVANLAVSHHEHGHEEKRYPRKRGHGNEDEKILLMKRLLAVTDEWEALMENRPYRRAMTRQQAEEAVYRDFPGQQQIVARFLELV
jgi:HD-GYP domain-containing protein (c-di-GMP phosphodiesterase class II)